MLFLTFEPVKKAILYAIVNSHELKSETWNESGSGSGSPPGFHANESYLTLYSVSYFWACERTILYAIFNSYELKPETWNEYSYTNKRLIYLKNEQTIVRNKEVWKKIPARDFYVPLRVQATWKN